MKIHVDRKNDTNVILEIEATKEELQKIKIKVLKQLAPDVKLSGFRDGKAPLDMVEKNVNQQMFQTEFMNEAINMLYIAALKEETIRPVSQPKVDVKKFVPFTTLEIKLEVPVVGEITLPDYKKTSAKRKEVKVAAKEINEVLENLQLRSAEKEEVKRAAKNGDEAVIDFKGTDKDGKEVAGATGEAYPLALGTKSFIPGFEEAVVGMKPGEKKDIPLTFPADYGSKDLQNKKVTFAVKLTKVMEVKNPKLDDAFAASVGPFKKLSELKDTIKTQLEGEAKQKVERDYESAVINELVKKVKVAIPDSLIDEQKEMVLSEIKQNTVQRGMTFDEFVKQSGMTEEEYIKKEVNPEADRRIKAGLILSEIADKEGIDVTAEELEARIQQLKGQYKDDKMQAELDKEENRREINARLRSEKVINFLKK